MEDKIFADSNIWLYAFMENGEKKKAAAAIIKNNKCILSTQVVNEVCVNLIKKADYGEEDMSVRSPLKVLIIPTFRGIVCQVRIFSLEMPFLPFSAEIFSWK